MRLFPRGIHWVSCALLVVAHAAHGQTGTIAGIVLVAGTDRPLADAQVSIVGESAKVAVSDAAGKFRIVGLTGTSVSINVRHIGFSPSTRSVSVGAADIRVALAERAIDLDAIVVTGTPGPVAKRELGTSVATIDAAAVLEQTAVPTLESLLNGRAPGVEVMPTTGQVGGGAQIRVRGVGSFSLSGTPLIYVDGIRIDNGQTNVGRETLGVARFNDIAPEEIQSIEILKGPAAATLYGTEAARGVINIITKRGAPGPATFTLATQSGTQWFRNAAGRFPTNFWINPATNDTMSINYVESEEANGTPLFRNGHIGDISMSTAGGSGNYRYFISGQSSRSEGIVPTNGRSQRNARANQSFVGRKFSLDVSVGYLTSRTNLAGEGATAGPMWGVFAQPQRTLAACPTPRPLGCGWSRGHIASPPEVTNATQRWLDVQRVTGGVSIKFDPFSWLSQRMLVGTDFTAEEVNVYLPYQTDSVAVFFLGSAFDGSRTQTTQRTTYTTYDYAATVHFAPARNVIAKSSIGVQYYTNLQSNLSASGSHFPTPGLSSVNSTSTQTPATSNVVGNNTLGAFVQQEVAFNDRLFLGGAIRVDNNSAFGNDVHFTTYPKLSVSWLAADRGRLPSRLPDAVNQLRFRAAYGASGQQPITSSALRTLTTVPGPGGSRTLTNGNFGNPDLKPERTVGTELGFEAALWRDRVGVDFTLFRDVSRDAILASTVSPSTGFGATTQFRNAGEIRRHGIELAFNTDLINNRAAGWKTELTLGTAHAKIVRLGAGADTMISVAARSAVATVGDIFHRVGYAPFDLFTYRVVSAQYDPVSRKAINPMCDDAHGGVIPCFIPGTATLQAPLVYFGHSIPTATGAWTNTFRYRALRLHVLVDFQKGHRKTDTMAEQNCQAFLVCPIVVFPDRYDPAIVATAQNSGVLQDYFIRSASFAKLRELSLAYSVPAAFADRFKAKSVIVSLTGRNLATFTRYSGIDPENSVTAATGGSSANFGTDQTEYPPLASVVLALRVSY